MLRLVRIMQTHRRIGILQTLVVGMPTDSAFARVFQFGMRHGMRAYTMGQAWWTGDCGPFWGHNALVRMRPFDEACRLPVLPGAPPLGGHILSHDQVEAVLMRRAGYEVRVAPIEGESWEDNPVTVLDFMKREQRWCNGNMQYFALLGMRGIQPASRFQLFQAIMMYLGAPAWMLMTVLAAAKAVSDDLALYDGALAVSLFAIMVGMSLAPKAAGLLDSALEPGGVRRYGGPARFAGGAAAELLFSMLMAPAVALRLSIFLAGLPFGRKIGWNGQIRDAYGVDWSDAARGLWPQTVLGAAVIATLAVGAPTVLYWAAPVLLGLTLAIPFAVATASPRFGRALSALGLGAIPEEVRPAPILQAVAREAAALSAAAPDPAAPAPAESVATPAPLAGPAVLTPGE
ncbi:MAG: glycosyltransferase family 2 protein [Pseudomonadota bacterium]